MTCPRFPHRQSQGQQGGEREAQSEGSGSGHKHKMEASPP